jgi:hypothetical protein
MGGLQNAMKKRIRTFMSILLFSGFAKVAGAASGFKSPRSFALSAG